MLKKGDFFLYGSNPLRRESDWKIGRVVQDPVSGMSPRKLSPRNRGSSSEDYTVQFIEIDYETARKNDGFMRIGDDYNFSQDVYVPKNEIDSDRSNYKKLNLLQNGFRTFDIRNDEQIPITLISKERSRRFGTDETEDNSYVMTELRISVVDNEDRDGGSLVELEMEIIGDPNVSGSDAFANPEHASLQTLTTGEIFNEVFDRTQERRSGMFGRFRSKVDVQSEMRDKSDLQYDDEGRYLRPSKYNKPELWDRSKSNKYGYDALNEIFSKKYSPSGPSCHYGNIRFVFSNNYLTESSANTCFFYCESTDTLLAAGPAPGKGKAYTTILDKQNDSDQQDYFGTNKVTGEDVRAENIYTNKNILECLRCPYCYEETKGNTKYGTIEQLNTGGTKDVPMTIYQCRVCDSLVAAGPGSSSMTAQTGEAIKQNASDFADYLGEKWNTREWLRFGRPEPPRSPRMGLHNAAAEEGLERMQEMAEERRHRDREDREDRDREDRRRRDRDDRGRRRDDRRRRRGNSNYRSRRTPDERPREQIEPPPIQVLPESEFNPKGLDRQPDVVSSETDIRSAPQPSSRTFLDDQPQSDLFTRPDLSSTRLPESTFSSLTEPASKFGFGVRSPSDSEPDLFGSDLPESTDSGSSSGFKSPRSRPRPQSPLYRKDDSRFGLGVRSPFKPSDPEPDLFGSDLPESTDSGSSSGFKSPRSRPRPQSPLYRKDDSRFGLGVRSPFKPSDPEPDLFGSDLPESTDSGSSSGFKSPRSRPRPQSPVYRKDESKFGFGVRSPRKPSDSEPDLFGSDLPESTDFGSGSFSSKVKGFGGRFVPKTSRQPSDETRRRGADDLRHIAESLKKPTGVSFGDVTYASPSSRLDQPDIYSRPVFSGPSLTNPPPRDALSRQVSPDTATRRFNESMFSQGYNPDGSPLDDPISEPKKRFENTRARASNISSGISDFAKAVPRKFNFPSFDGGGAKSSKKKINRRKNKTKRKINRKTKRKHNLKRNMKTKRNMKGGGGCPYRP